MHSITRFTLYPLVGAALTTAIITFPATLQAQGMALEEVVVTAQRREQSLQEVPISIESFSGTELQQQGYRNLDDLANFSASVLVNDEGYLSQERTVRGFGTSGNALTLEQAVPIFIDGIHYGRPSQVKTAFMDLDRIEVLKGPQPVYFGMSATAGAFNIQSAKPTPQWEGYLDAEYGNRAKAVVEGAFGGPLTDTFGIRVAGKYETSEGFMEDVISGDKFTPYKNFGGRVILQWTPNNEFDATFKVEGSKIDKGVEAPHICLTDGSMLFNEEDPTSPSDEGNERSIWADPPKGEGSVLPFEPLGRDCFGNNKGVSAGGPYYAPPITIAEENSQTGAIDAREAVDHWNRLLWDRTDGQAGSPHGVEGVEEINSWTGYLDLGYRLDNGIEVDWLTGYSYYDRLNVRDNSRSPFLLNMQDRVEIFDQYSSELRFTSPVGGMFEWMVGFFWQKQDYDITSNGPRPNVRRGLRFNDLIWEDQEWKSVFATVTFNFLDDRASIDLGGRYVDLNKTGYIQGKSGMWVFDTTPCAATEDPAPADPVEFLDDDGGGDPSAADGCSTGIHPEAIQITAADTEFVLPGADTSNLWTFPFRATEVTPSTWRGGRAAAVGLTELSTEGRRDPFTPDRGGDFSSNEFDPQVTLRYRMGEHSIFARWAQAFKAGGFDTGVTSINRTVEDFRFESESAETFEVGAKGNYWGERARYDVTVFETTFNDFQITVPTGNPDDPFLNANAGGQRVRGIEFNTQALVTERLTASLSGAIMDGEMTFFPAGGCTTEEALTAPESGCVLDDPDNPGEGGTIDRSGEAAPRTPDWKFVLSLDYSQPVLDDFLLNFNAKGYISDGYITDINGFSKDVKYNQHEDLNMSLGIGPRDGTWEFSVWGRNLLEARPSYNPEFDALPDGFLSSVMSPNNFMSYGAKFRYNFR